MQLRDYQQNLKTGLYQSWQQGNDNVILVSPTGSGKTVTMGSIAQDQSEPGTLIAHRTELVGQISLTLAKLGIHHNVIASDTTVKFCIQQHILEQGRKFFNRSAPVTVASVDTLRARSNDLTQWRLQQKWWMIDECFVAGTLVDNTPIEQVRVGHVVTSFDENTGELVRRTVTRTFRNPMPRGMFRVDTGHHSVYVTGGHPFWTKRGWVVAAELTTRDEILTDTLRTMRSIGRADKRSAALPLAQDGSDILQQKMRVFPSKRAGKASGIAAATDDDLPRLRIYGASGSQHDVAVSENQPSILWKSLFDSVPLWAFFENYGADQPQTRIGSYDREQSNASRRSSRKGVAVIEGNPASTQNSRWERQARNASGSEVDEHVRVDGVHTTVCGEDRLGKGLGSDALQDRLREPETDGSDRGGRSESRGAGKTSLGRTQRQVLDWQGVVGVSLLERNDPELPGDGFVYNIEVDGTHTYLANGFVAHNCHHCLGNNKWGTAATEFVNARGVGVTATPLRADRKSLHHDQGGIFHDMIVGPSMRELISQGRLSDYRIYAPAQSIDLSQLRIGSTGDYAQPGLREAAHESRIVGDVVDQYLRFASGKRGITFTVDVDLAVEIADAFNLAGVPAMAVSARTQDAARAAAVRKFRDGELLQLVNVDLFGEGFDVPAVECVSMARPTASYGLFVQQFGRSLRPLGGKNHGIIIDHVGNVGRHGLPDAPRQWRLWDENFGKRKRRTDNEPDIPVTTCEACFAAYERVHKACPYCGHESVPAGRGRPEQVDGDLIELTPEVLAQMRGEIERIDGEPIIPHTADEAVIRGAKAQHRRRQEAQQELRDAMGIWGGIRLAEGDTDSMMQRRFYHTFGIDVMSAQALGRPDAEELKQRIEKTWQE